MQFPKLDVAGSIPVSRSNVFNKLRGFFARLIFKSGSILAPIAPYLIVANAVKAAPILTLFDEPQENGFPADLSRRT